jgi:hypothetical protein
VGVATSGKRFRLIGGALLTAAVLAGTAAASQPQSHWCQARSSAAWQRLLSRHVVALSRTTPLVPLALSANGNSIFAETYSPSFSGVGRIDTRTGRLHEIKTFPDPQFTQAWGAFDGRWLVWNEYHGFDNLNDFTVWAWDSQSGDLSEIGATTRGPDGQFWDSPWRGADVRGGIATWVQGTGPDQLAEVHAYNLRAGRDLVVRHGHPGGAFLLDRHVLVWAEASAPGIPTRMHAASSLTGAAMRVPRALQRLRNVTGLQTDGRRIAYPNAPYKSLWWSPSVGQTPHEVVGTQGLDHVDNSVQISGRFVGFGIFPRVFVADTTLHRYITVATHGGSAMVSAAALLVTLGPRKKVLHPVLRMAFMPLRDLPPMPACS